MSASTLAVLCGLIALGILGWLLVVYLRQELRHTRRALELEKFYANAERESHLQAESRMRDQVRDAMARDEVARLAIDAAEAMTHDTARMVDALQDAIAVAGGKPAEWKRLCPKYRIEDRVFTPATLKEAAIAEWQRLLAEVQAAESEPAATATATATATPAAPRPGHLRLVRKAGGPAPAAAVYALAKADIEPLDTIGPGIGA